MDVTLRLQCYPIVVDIVVSSLHTLLVHLVVNLSRNFEALELSDTFYFFLMELHVLVLGPISLSKLLTAKFLLYGTRGVVHGEPMMAHVNKLKTLADGGLVG